MTLPATTGRWTTSRQYPDKGSADGAGLDKGPGVGTDNGAGLAEVLAELEARQTEVEVLRADFNEGTAARQRGRHGTRPATRQACRRRYRQACNEAATQETMQAGDDAGREVTWQSGNQAGMEGGRQAGRHVGILNSELKRFNKYILL